MRSFQKIPLMLYLFNVQSYEKINPTVTYRYNNNNNKLSTTKTVYMYVKKIGKKKLHVYVLGVVVYNVIVLCLV